jgi:hypothetical protein
MQGILPSQPDVWIWMGDMAYLDAAPFNCTLDPTARDCTCTADFLHIPPHGCRAGDLDNARDKMTSQVQPRHHLQSSEQSRLNSNSQFNGNVENRGAAYLSELLPNM